MITRRNFLVSLGAIALAMKIGLPDAKPRTPRIEAWWKCEWIEPPKITVDYYLAFDRAGQIVERPIEEHPQFERLKRHYGLA